jgi:hypothetical protein
LTQTTTRPVDDLDTMVAAAGFADVTRREYPRASMALVTARRDVARRDAAVRGEGDPS